MADDILIEKIIKELKDRIIKLDDSNYYLKYFKELNINEDKYQFILSLLDILEKESFNNGYGCGSNNSVY
jgi:hypothetical protein